MYGLHHIFYDIPWYIMGTSTKFNNRPWYTSHIAEYPNLYPVYLFIYWVYTSLRGYMPVYACACTKHLQNISCPKDSNCEPHAYCRANFTARPPAFMLRFLYLWYSYIGWDFFLHVTCRLMSVRKSTRSKSARSGSLAQQEDPLYIYNESELRAHVRSQVPQLANASAHTRRRRHIPCTCTFAHWHDKYTRAVICEGSAV